MDGREVLVFDNGLGMQRPTGRNPCTSLYRHHCDSDIVYFCWQLPGTDRNIHCMPCCVLLSAIKIAWVLQRQAAYVSNLVAFGPLHSSAFEGVDESFSPMFDGPRHVDRKKGAQIIGRRVQYGT